MARVDFPDGTLPFFNPAAYTGLKPETKKARDRPQVRDAKGSRFSRILEDSTRETEGVPRYEASEEVLQELLDNVHSTGDDLKNRPFPDEIKKYKQAVRNFLHYVVENGYDIAEQTGGANLLKRKKYTLVQVVDQKLEQLAAGILAGQTAQMELLSRIDEIAGLLVNLLQ